MAPTCDASRGSPRRATLELDFAVMPEELVRVCIDAGCPRGGRVLDPFLGAGTSGVVAEDMDMGIDFYGIELSPEHARHATERILAARAKRMSKCHGTLRPIIQREFGDGTDRRQRTDCRRGTGPHMSWTL